MSTFYLIIVGVFWVLGSIFVPLALIMGNFVDAFIIGLISWYFPKFLLSVIAHTTTNSTPSASQISRM